MSLADLGRSFAGMSPSQAARYTAGMDPDDLDALELAIAAAEAEAGRESIAARYARWWGDPSAFASEAFTWAEDRSLHGYQAEALLTLSTSQRLVLTKLRGAGGTAIAAIAVLWFAATRDFYGVDWKVVTTASVGRQLEFYLWPEVHKWAKRLHWEHLGRTPWTHGDELLQQAIKLAHGAAVAASPGDAATIEGAHASQVLVVFDEAKGIRDEVFDAIEGGGTRYGPETGAVLHALALSTPGEPVGRFYDLSRGEKGAGTWARQHITLPEAIAAGQVSESSAEALRQLWGEDSALYANHVLGEFRSDAADTVIPLSWVQAANERWLALGAAGRAVASQYVGIDVARGGRDRSVLAAMGTAADGAPIIGRPVELPRGDGPEVARGTLGHVGLGPHGPWVLVDSEGVGASVYDHLRRNFRDLGPRVLAFTAGAGTEWRDSSRLMRFANLRGAGWWNLRQMLDPALGATMALPPGDALTGDLCTPKWHAHKTRPGFYVIESKDDIRARLGRSTDEGDAVMMAAFGPVLRAGANLRPVKAVAAGGSTGFMGDILHEGL